MSQSQNNVDVVAALEKERDELLRANAELKEQNATLLRSLASLIPGPEIDLDRDGLERACASEPPIEEILQELERKHAAHRPAPVQGKPAPGSQSQDQSVR